MRPRRGIAPQNTCTSHCRMESLDPFRTGENLGNQPMPTQPSQPLSSIGASEPGLGETTRLRGLGATLGELFPHALAKLHLATNEVVIPKIASPAP